MPMFLSMIVCKWGAPEWLLIIVGDVLMIQKTVCDLKTGR